MSVPPSNHIHPFLRGNFAPVTDEYIAYPCKVTGKIPQQLLGGQYIRNGGNPVYPPEKGRHYHWFDGDGMLHGVLFPDSPDSLPTYTNRHLATPLLALTLLLLRSPIPSIALLISPLSSLHRIISAIIQAFFIAVRAQMGVLSVANTSVVWWGTGLGTESTSSTSDHRLLATCESGPPLEVRVPDLETVDWDRLDDGDETLANRRGDWPWWKRWSLPRVQEDWMTAHPRVDPVDGSLIFYSTQMFDAPHARYSVIDRHGKHLIWKQGIDVGRAKMMHDFGASRKHTILLNLPLTLSPANFFSLPPVPLIHFDRNLPSEFIVFPRLQPDAAKRYTQPEPSLVFHTANAWDDDDAVNMLGCRFKSAKLVYAAGAVEAPAEERFNDVVRLHYYRFASDISSFPLTAIPFEFPSVPTDLAMSKTRYVYGCTMKSGSFDERLGGAAKVDCLVKINVEDLIAKGVAQGNGIDDPVDKRTTAEIMADPPGPIEVFACPDGWYAQETRFVPRSDDEDDGYLLTYMYDEANLQPDGTPSSAGSELWVIDAKIMAQGMAAVVCRVELPQRIPYGQAARNMVAAGMDQAATLPPTH